VSYASRASHLKQSALDVLAWAVSYPGHRKLFTARPGSPGGILVNSRAELPWINAAHETRRPSCDSTVEFRRWSWE